LSWSAGEPYRFKVTPVRGPAFEVYFPELEEEPIESLGEPSRRVPTGNERVLLVDDEVLNVLPDMPVILCTGLSDSM
jgi:hypothetical protein